MPFPSAAPMYPRHIKYQEAERTYRAEVDAFHQTPEYKAWSASRHEMRRLVDNYPAELKTYGYTDEPSYCVRVKASVQRADDYGSIELAPLVVGEDWERSLREFIDLMELPTWRALPCWHLNCSYG